MLNLVYDWAATLSNAFLVAVICTFGFRHGPVGRSRVSRGNLLHIGLAILAVGESAVLAAALRFGPRPVNSSLITQLASSASLLISAIILQALGASWWRGRRFGGRRGPGNSGGANGAGTPARLGHRC